MALSLYRKYRPEVFADVVGQEHVEKTLINAISDGSVAHAYLFCGPRGTGKTTTARLLAKALLCENSQNAQPDGSCPQCVEIAQGTHPDVFELDAASRTGVDNVREEIIGRVGFAPTRGRYKVYIIDEVHMLSTAAFNALLKTLEEPPEHVIFVMCTTDPHKVPDTIQSRCQRFDFRRFSVEEIMTYLERISSGEGFTYEPEALEFIAAKSAGGMRDATTALEQVAVYGDKNISLDNATRMLGQIDISALFEIAGYIAHRDTSSCFIWINDLVGKGVDLSQFARDLSSHLRNLYVTAITGGDNGIVSCTAAQLQRYQQQAQEFGGVDRLARALDVCGSLVTELRNSPDSRLSVEIAMTRLTRPDSELTLEALAERIESLEQGASFSGAQASFASYAQPQPQAAAPANSQAVDPEPVAKAASPVEEPVASQEPPQPAQTEVSTPPVQTPEPAASNPNIDTSNMSAERLLAAVLSVIRREDEAVSALLNGISLEQEGDAYNILFPTGADFQMTLIKGAKETALINKAFNEVLGHEVTFSCRLGSFASMTAQPAASEPEPYDNPIDTAYYDSLAAGEDDAALTDGPSDIADPLAVFGAGVKVQEISGEE